MRRLSRLLTLVVTLAPPSALAQPPGSRQTIPPLSISENENGFNATNTDESIAITVCSDSVLHFVSHSIKSSGDIPAQPWMLDRDQACPGGNFSIAQTAEAVTLTSTAVKFFLSRVNGSTTYSSLDGKELLHEGRAVPRTYKPMEANGEQTFEVEDRFSPDPIEGFYGLGQHQSGHEQLSRQHR